MKTAVCICTYRRNALLDALLASLARADLCGAQVVVADNNPDGGAEPVARAHGAVYAHESRRGIPHARNRAIATAWNLGADFAAFLDDDDLPEPDWLAELLSVQRESGADLVFGSIRLTAPAHLRDADLPLFRNPARNGTGNVLISRSAADRLDPVFCPSLARIGGEDHDFSARASASGATFATAEQSVVNARFEPERTTTWGLARTGFFRGYAGMVVAKRHGERCEIRRRVKYILVNPPRLLVGLPRTTKRRLYKAAKAAGMAWGALR